MGGLPQMSQFTLARAAAWLDAHWHGSEVAIDGVAIDSRALRPGQLFVALSGPTFDGHHFVAEAAEKGAAAALVSRPLALALPQLQVADTRLALGRLAAAWRLGLPGRVVAVTGSNGKTTAKEMIAAVLGRAGSVCATQGNLNNEIGLPLTLLRAAAEDFIVTEIGASHAGEVAALSAIARPQVALITNAGRAHLQGFGSVEGVARAKGEIIQGLAPDGVFVLNADDAWAPLWREFAGARRVVSFGLSTSADVHPVAADAPWRLDDEGFHAAYRVRAREDELPLRLALPGRHNLLNALAAIAVAEALRLPLPAAAAALAELAPVRGRLCPLPGRRGEWLIDDSYNANPDSVAAALQVLSGLPGRRWLLLGDLAELGAGARQWHHDIGLSARRAGIEHLWAVGPLSREAVAGFGDGARHFEHQDALLSALEQSLERGDVVLVKGSRSAAMDRLVSLLARSGDE
jgi:UDP-N-acetylmuramoyl-tripeptide--D-alanyl-D-alanine ligase